MSITWSRQEACVSNVLRAVRTFQLLMKKICARKKLVQTSNLSIGGDLEMIEV